MARWITNSKLIQVLLLLTMAFAPLAMGQTNETDWFNMGMYYYGHHQFEEAIQAYDKAIELNPQDAEAWNNKGTALGMQGRYDEALETFEQAIAINSSYAEAWYNMGMIYDLRGEYYLAIRAYNEATQINPQYQKAWEAKNDVIGIIGMRDYLDLIHEGNS